MANYSGNNTVSETSGVSTVDVITFPLNARVIEVTNLASANPIYVTTNNTAPTVGGLDCFVVPPLSTVLLPNQQPADGTITNYNTVGYNPRNGDSVHLNTVVQVIASAASAYYVSIEPVQRAV